jgi:nucleotidyltransferase/DNA polymerase involved in DNA repair
MAMVPALADALGERPDVVTDAALAIAQRGADALEQAQLVAAMEELGWGKARLHDVEVCSLEDALRERLAANLVHHVQRLSLGWEKRGLFGSG